MWLGPPQGPRDTLNQSAWKCCTKPRKHIYSSRMVCKQQNINIYTGHTFASLLLSMLLTHHLTSPGKTSGEEGKSPLAEDTASCASTGWSKVGSRLWHSRLCLLAAPLPAEPGDSFWRSQEGVELCCSRALSCVRCSWFSWHLLLSTQGNQPWQAEVPWLPLQN